MARSPLTPLFFQKKRSKKIPVNKNMYKFRDENDHKVQPINIVVMD